MKKFMLPFLLISTIVIGEAFIFKTTFSSHLLISKQEQVINKNVARSFDPTAPSFTKNINWDNYSYAETGGTWGGDNTKKVETSYYYINILDYASDWNNFKNKYSQIKIDFKGYVDHSKASKYEYNSYHYINLSSISDYAKTSRIFSHYQSYTQNEGEGWTDVRYQLENNQIKIDFLVYAKAKNGWNSMNTWTKTWLKINKLIFDTTFNFDNMHNYLENKLNQEFSYYSNLDNDPLSSNNWSQIKQQMNYKIRHALNDNYDTQGWIEFLNPDYQLEKLNNNYYIKTSFDIYDHKNANWETWTFETPLNFDSDYNINYAKNRIENDLNKTIAYYSSVSTNILDESNWNAIKTILDNKIFNVLGQKGNIYEWRKLVNPNYALITENSNYFLKTSINVYNHLLKQWENWIFKTPLNFDSDYNINYAKNRLENELNKTIIYQSDTSTNILDESNWNAIKTILNNKIFNVLGQKGSIYEWRKLVNPSYALITENSNYFLKTSINVYNHLLKQWENWVFKTKLNFSLSAKYWKTKLQERILITPGKISDENGVNMINDIEEVINNGEGKENKYNGGTIKYHTTTFFQYIEPKDNSNDPDYDIVKINGINLNAVNGLYTYIFDDKEKVNKYDIEIIHRSNPKIKGDVGGNFKLTILIETITPSLQLKLMGWGPKNIDYEKLTSEFIKDPSNENKTIQNPNYDKEISKETGTKKQLIWVRHKSNTPFPLDPIDKNGNLIETNQSSNYDVGYLAEASAVEAGFENFFNNDNIEKVSRYSSNEKLSTKFEHDYQLEKNKSADVNTSAGWFHFIIQQKRFNDLNGNTQTPFYQNKFIYVDKNKASNYGYFLNSVDIQYASDFWTTIQGKHLKEYMINYKKWNPNNDLANLNYESVLSYWRDYVSDIRNHLAINESNNDFKSLNDLNISALKMNAKDIKTIKEKLNNYVWQEINKISLLATINKDYIIQIYKNQQWQKIKDDDFKQLITNQQEQTKEITIKIKATNTSMILVNDTNEFKVINNLKYDEDKVIDLSKINYQNQEYNFKDKTTEDVFNNYIIQYINQGFKVNKLDELLKQGVDYQISLQGINGKQADITDQQLQEFMQKIKVNKFAQLNIVIYAKNDSLNAIGNVAYKLINNPINENAPNKPNEIQPTKEIIPKKLSDSNNDFNGNNESENNSNPNNPNRSNGQNGNNESGSNSNSNNPNNSNDNDGNNKPDKPNNNSQNPNLNNESGWKNFLKKPVNLFFMTLISCAVVGTFITWIIIKNQLNKKIGGKKLRKPKAKKTKNNK